MSGRTQHIVQPRAGPTPAAPVAGAVVPVEIFQLLDPPFAASSPEKREHRDCEITTISITCSTTSTTDTVFNVWLTNADAAAVDVLDGAGVLPAGEKYVEWSISPRVAVTRVTSILQVQFVTIGTGATGLIVEVLFF